MMAFTQQIDAALVSYPISIKNVPVMYKSKIFDQAFLHHFSKKIHVILKSLMYKLHCTFD